MLKLALRLAIISNLLLLTWCGNDKESLDGKKTVGEDAATNDRRRSRFTFIPTGLVNPNKDLNLVANATTYKIHMDECASGFSSDADELSTNLQVYKFDQGCLGKLEEFSINSITYSSTAAGATNFSSFAVGQTAIFANAADQTDLIGVKVVTQISATVVDGDTVSYLFYDIEAGATNDDLDQSVVGVGHTMSVSGQAAPSFTINEVRFVNMTVAGEGEFEFSMECSVALTNANTTCKDIILTDIDYKLVEDTYSDVVSLTDADTIFGTAGTSVAAGERVTVGGTDNDGNTLANGGFYTNETTPLTGPATIHSKPEMILILRAGSSYQYFNVDVTPLVQD